ncbi:MAG: PIN domain-containing protein [Chloroflexi bacterium]|nr:PIN domain-containing protein [Chloroflexota bacterium]
MEKIFVDTSALLCLANTADPFSDQAWILWNEFIKRGDRLFTNNYVIVEAFALIQHRHGMEIVRRFESSLMPFLEVFWIGKDHHRIIVDSFLLANRRQLSLVDCSGFETMRQLGIKQVFTLDEHFREQGFTVIP